MEREKKEEKTTVSSSKDQNSFSSSCIIQGDNLFIVGGVKWTPGMPDIFLIDLQSGKTSSYKVDLSVSIHACI